MEFSREDWIFELQRALDAVAWAVRMAINPSIKYSPTHLAFNQDMIFRQAANVNWNAVHTTRNKITEMSNNRENSARITQQYTAGNQVLIVLDAEEHKSQPKMGKPTRGPYTITQVHDNGTVTINCGTFSETINIRRIKPYHTG
jgi:hypothetical protein